MTHQFRRNDIVSERDTGGYVFFGRVNRVLPNNLVEVIDCGKHIKVYHVLALELHNDYQGYWDTRKEDFPVFVRMPTLRKLKQRAAYYNPQVFKKNRKKVDRKSDGR